MSKLRCLIHHARLQQAGRQVCVCVFMLLCVSVFGCVCVCFCVCVVCVGRAGNRCAVIALSEGVGLSVEASLPSQCGAPLPVGLMYGGGLIRRPDQTTILC